MTDSFERPAADATLDIRTQKCPMTFVRTRLALDRMLPGQVLAVRLRGAEPIASVPKTAAELGHSIVSLTEEAGGEALLLLRRA